MSFYDFSQTLTEIKLVSKTKEKVEIVKNLFNYNIIYDTKLFHLLTNQLEVSYKQDRLQLNIGESLIKKCKEQFVEINHSDDYRSNYSIDDIFETLKQIAQISSRAERQEIIIEHWNNMSEVEIDIFNQLLKNSLRIGLQSKTIIQALAELYEISNLDKLYKENIDIEELLTMSKAFSNIEHALSVGIPMQPMLAQALKTLEKHNVTDHKFEFKFDGERIQIHIQNKLFDPDSTENNVRYPNITCDDIEIQLYSRNHKNDASKYPDLIQQLKQQFVNSLQHKDFCNCIIDGEILFTNTEHTEVYPFQEIAQRSRKFNNKKAKQEIEDNNNKILHVFCFDLVLQNNEVLLDYNLDDRREFLSGLCNDVQSFNDDPISFSVVEQFEVAGEEELFQLMNESMQFGCEGLIMKSNTKYKCDSRSGGWYKLKKDYFGATAFDTVDLVVMGVKLGKGNRSSVYGSFLLGLSTMNDVNVNDHCIQSICSVGTGFTEEQLQHLYDQLNSDFDLLEECPANYEAPKNTKMDYYCVPKNGEHLLFEIEFADISESPDHSFGYSLRFPRFKRIREDKRETSSPDLIMEMYHSDKNLG